MASQDAHGLRRTTGSVPPLYSALRPMRGMVVHLLFLALATPEHPVAQVNGRLAEVRPDALIVEVDGPLPRLESHIRFGVELFSPTGLMHFYSRPAAPVEAGAEQVTLVLPDKLETVQRRRFARTPYSGEVLYQSIHKGKPLPGGKGLGIDLSAGGLKMSTTTPLKEGQELLLHFQTPDGRVYRSIPSRVMRLEHQGSRYAVACRFEGLTEVQEAALVQAVFRMQVRSAAPQK